MSSTRPYSAPDLSYSTTDQRIVRTLWWLSLASAVASVVLGIMVLTWPDATLFVAAMLFGLWLLVHGAFRIVDAITATAEEGAVRALRGVVGVLFVVAGVISLRRLLVSLLAIATLIGVSWLIAGIAELMAAFGPRGGGGARFAVGMLGALTILGGLVVLLWPGASLTTILYVTGFWLIVMGFAQVLVALRARPRG
jgi:uncharacterized membrane protein HdeD (DUF308 family)